MNKYNIKMKIDFQGEIEAESEKEAEDKAWLAWGANSDAEISYDGVYSIDVEDLGEICSECEEGADNCDCEEVSEEEQEQRDRDTLTENTPDLRYLED
jgi:hypothetical protein